MPGGNGTGSLDRGRRGGRMPAQESAGSDLLASAVGTLVMALGAMLLRKLTGKFAPGAGSKAAEGEEGGKVKIKEEDS
ncbi:MAG: hypothetical protein WC299_06845 [Kiritimatiellia bacterium]